MAGQDKQLEQRVKGIVDLFPYAITDGLIKSSKGLNRKK